MLLPRTAYDHRGQALAATPGLLGCRNPDPNVRYPQWCKVRLGIDGLSVQHPKLREDSNDCTDRLREQV